MHFLTHLLLAATPEALTVAELNTLLEDQSIELVGVWGAPEQDAVRAQGLQGTVVVVSGADSLRAVLKEQGQDCGLLLAHPTPETWTPRTVCVKRKLPVVAAPAPAAPASRLDALLALPDHAARKAAILEELQSPQTSAGDLEKLSAALAVVGALDEQGRTDPFVVKLFLQGALSSDAGLRSEAITAARAGQDPPMGLSKSVK